MATAALFDEWMALCREAGQVPAAPVSPAKHLGATTTPNDLEHPEVMSIFTHSPELSGSKPLGRFSESDADSYQQVLSSFGAFLGSMTSREGGPEGSIAAVDGKASSGEAVVGSCRGSPFEGVSLKSKPEIPALFDEWMVLCRKAEQDATVVTVTPGSPANYPETTSTPNDRDHPKVMSIFSHSRETRGSQSLGRCSESGAESYRQVLSSFGAFLDSMISRDGGAERTIVAVDGKASSGEAAVDSFKGNPFEGLSLKGGPEIPTAVMFSYLVNQLVSGSSNGFPETVPDSVQKRRRFEHHVQPDADKRRRRRCRAASAFARKPHAFVVSARRCASCDGKGVRRLDTATTPYV